MEKALRLLVVRPLARHVLRLLGCAFLLAGLTRPALAQIGLDSQYRAPDGSFQFLYPAIWQVQAGRGLAPVRVVGGTISLLVYGPDSLAGLGLGSITAPADLARAFLSTLQTQSHQVETPTALTLDGRPAARLDFIDTQGKNGLLLAVTFRDGRLGLIHVLTTGAAMLPLDVDTALDVAASFDAGSQRLPIALAGYETGWESTVRELERLGIIPYGGGLVFQADRAVFSGEGAHFNLMAGDRPQRDVVVGGWLTFTPGSAADYEDCRLGARVTQADGRLGAYLDAGITREGRVFYNDHTQDATTISGESTPYSRPLAGPHHVLLIALDQTLSVYVDGQLMFEEVPVEARPGAYGLGLTAASAATSCTGQDLWAYAVPVITPGVCEASAATPINQRSGPGVGYAPLGRLTPGVVQRVVGQATDPAGYLWWMLGDGSWVREDVIVEVGDCRSLPVVTP